MNQLGIFAKTFARPTWQEILEAAAQHRFGCVQFNFSCAGLPTVPDYISESLTRDIRARCEQLGLPVVGVSATFNMIDPDLAKRREWFSRLPTAMKATREIGCNLVTLCTGTRDPRDMWRAHPDNDTATAWTDLLAGIEKAIADAEAHNVFLGIEPETGNIISSARKARQLLDDLRSTRLKIVFDAANLFHHGRVEQMQDTIKAAADLLGSDIVMAHAKEIAADGSVGTVAPGKGMLDWDCYFSALRNVGFHGPVVVHGLAEQDVREAAEFLRRKL